MLHPTGDLLHPTAIIKSVPQPHHLYFNRFDETAQQLATGCIVITDTSKTGAIRPHLVVGTLTIRQAVQMAITGTTLRITHQDGDSITVE
ncbi:hypothetical protein [Dickeya oryzae]|uniref:hypothetical protein n=1 Tax=Dickeya oryzae TaxID=1240404 RepID=UPI003D0FBCE1